MLFENSSIQDVFNMDEMVSRYYTEAITVSTLEGTMNKFVATYPISKIEEAKDQYGNELDPTLYIPQCHEIKFQGKNVLTHADVTSIEMTYIKEYQWASWPLDKDTAIPLPDKYIPGLIKLIYDWAAPINLMSGETSTFDFYSHAMNRFNTIAQNDGLSNTFRVKPARN